MTLKINILQREWADATHEITIEHPRPSYRRETIEVRLVDGVLYTEAEWTTETSADWELVGGDLRFQGRPADDYTGIAGTVVLREYAAMGA